MKKILILLLLLCCAGNVSAQKWKYFHFKEPRPLTLDTSRIAVQHTTDAKVEAAQAIATKAGLGKPDVQNMPIARWRLLKNLAARPEAALPPLTTQMAQEPEAEFVSPVFRSKEGGEVIITPHILVRFAPQVGKLQADKSLAEIGAVEKSDWAGIKDAYRVRCSSRDGFEVLEAANRLAQRADVLWAEPDVIFTGRNGFIPNDTNFGDCWGLRNTGQSGGKNDEDMDADEAWDNTLGDEAVIVVVIDSGVQQDHPDIHQRAGADFTSEGGNGGPVNQFDNHGTLVAGCISATIHNNRGVVGVAPGCRVASARTFITVSSGSWTSQASWTVNALQWAQTIGARVTNNSNSYGFTSSAIETKYADTRRAGILHFASAGNNGSGSLSYPASIESVNAVAALNRHGNRTGFSQFGPGLDFSAPGEDIRTTDRTGTAGIALGDYAEASGTSFASPYAAGVAALGFSMNLNFTTDELENVMRFACVDKGTTGYDTGFGWGFINANTLVRNIGIYVNKNYNGIQRGTPFQPYSTITAAVNAANPNNRTPLFIRGANYNERPVINKRLYLREWDPFDNPLIGAP